jgi:nicotinate-nucleotide--dimethylbenzimidazole phosphoribosyltransferase
MKFYKVKPKKPIHGEILTLLESLTMPKSALDGLLKPLAEILSQSEDLEPPQFALQMQKSEPLNRNFIQLKTQAVLFAGDHGIAGDAAVSAYPQAITGAMVQNLVGGGAALSVLCKNQAVPLTVVNCGVLKNHLPPESLLKKLVEKTGINYLQQDVTHGEGTKSFLKEPALSDSQFDQAFDNGFQLVSELHQKERPHLLIFGEMGIGNSTSAAALASLILKCEPRQVTGPGTGLTQLGPKIEAVQKGVNLHLQAQLKGVPKPLEYLRCVGGAEMVTMAGAMHGACHFGIPILLDGFIVSSVAAALCESFPESSQWLIAGHLSPEPGHRLLLERWGLHPLLNLGLRLGEASGALMALSLLQQGCQLLRHMATFQDLGS